MAVYRTIHISFWQDPFILKLTPEEKYFYIYLMTNSKTNQIGCYEIAKSIMTFETGYNTETIEKLISRFTDNKKIQYAVDTEEMLLFNWHKYSWSKSPTVKTCIENEFKLVKNIAFQSILQRLFIDYGYSMDSLCIKKEKEKEEKEEETKTENNNYKDIIDYLNQKNGSSYKDSSKTTQKHINARLAEGYNLDNFKTVIDKKVLEWKNNKDMVQYLRPETLFGTKFEGYLNQKAVSGDNPKPPNNFHNAPQRAYTAEDYANLEKKLINKGL